MKPSERYYEIIQQSGYDIDLAQQQAILLLDDLSLRINLGRETDPDSWLKKLIGSKYKKESVKGLYFWGGVGRGKTFLMDIFYQSMPEQKKTRRHFHDFMNQTHRALKKKSNLENPLKAIAGELAETIDVLCLDEFVITDIGDAMIMAGLLEHLFDSGVVLVTTSNSAPQNLYRDGLQRVRFLPAIDLISQHCEIVNLDGGKDYRLLGLQQTHLYVVPNSQNAEEDVQRYLDEHATAVQTSDGNLKINGRNIAFQVCAEDTIWFNFESLCKTTRSQIDYLEIARLFNTLILTDIEVMTKFQDDIARRFVLLIDIMYDHRVKLICTAAASADSLYLGEKLSFEFERTSSRLIEMQSQQYLSQEHSQQ